MLNPARAAFLGAASLVLLAPCLFAADSDRVPAKLVFARYVAIGIETGDDFVSETQAMTDNRLLSGDLETLSKMRKLVEGWKRYAITLHPDQAELLIAVRPGRRTVVGGEVTFGSSDARRSGRSFQVGVDVSLLDDMLTVYDARDGLRGPILWRSQREDGLSKSSPRLFEELKTAVEKADPKKP